MASGINLTNLSSIFNHMQTDKSNKARTAISNSCLKASLVFTPQKVAEPSPSRGKAKERSKSRAQKQGHSNTAKYCRKRKGPTSTWNGGAKRWVRVPPKTQPVHNVCWPSHLQWAAKPSLADQLWSWRLSFAVHSHSTSYVPENYGTQYEEWKGVKLSELASMS